MSKKAKKIQKEKRLEKKRKIKAANKAKYAALREAGQNSKSKRFMKQDKKTKRVNVVSHPHGKCGNIGCVQCDPNNIHKFKN